ncbi:MAG: Crp/Fnr family transcriptional regulator [Bacillota bacterium]|nr:Crp/Fnr family transcriptional regulator [Bacillota bacterium]
MPDLPSCAAGVPIFQVLPQDALRELTAALRHARFGEGETIAADGAPVEYLVVVAHGRAKLVHTSAAGREQVVRVLGPGEFWGEMALFAPARQEGDLIALEETMACLVPRHAVQSLMQRYPDVAVRLVESLAQRLAASEQLIADLGLRDVGQRLAAELCRLAETGTARMRGVAVRVPMPWAQLAMKLGTTPESLSRKLKALAGQGLIQHRGGSREVVVLDLERLLRLAGK